MDDRTRTLPFKGNPAFPTAAAAGAIAPQRSAASPHTRSTAFIRSRQLRSAACYAHLRRSEVAFFAGVVSLFGALAWLLTSAILETTSTRSLLVNGLVVLTGQVLMWCVFQIAQERELERLDQQQECLKQLDLLELMAKRLPAGSCDELMDQVKRTLPQDTSASSQAALGTASRGKKSGRRWGRPLAAQLAFNSIVVPFPDPQAPNR
jgi:hypothetical protein